MEDIIINFLKGISIIILLYPFASAMILGHDNYKNDNIFTRIYFYYYPLIVVCLILLFFFIFIIYYLGKQF